MFVKRATISAAVYAALALVGLQLALPLPGDGGIGYASPLWPAAGWAVAAAIYWGRAGGVGVAIGSAVANVFGHLGGPTWPDVMLGLGAGAQAWVAAHLVLRYVNNRFRFRTYRSIAGFLFAAGPVACLVNATWGPLWLWSHGILQTELMPLNMVLWWAGDWLGVVVVAPMCLAILDRRPPWPSRRRSLVPIESLTLAVHAILFLFVRDVILVGSDPGDWWIWVLGAALAGSLALLSFLLMILSVRPPTGHYLAGPVY